MTTTRSMSSSKESFYTARTSLNSRGKLLNPIVELNGKSYHLTVYHKNPGSDWEEITQNYLKLAKRSDFQEIVQQAGMLSSKKIDIQAFIHPETHSIHCDIQNENRKIEVSLTKPQTTKIFEILKRIRESKSVSDSSSSSSLSLSKESLQSLNSSFIKMSLEEIKAKRTYDYLKEVNTNFNRSENNVESSNKKPHLEYSNKLNPYERAIGLNNSGNNCCVNVTLQIILNNPGLRKIWEECFPETKNLYYKALNTGKSSAPETVSKEFRKQLIAQSSNSNLIDKSPSTQDDPTAFLEVFFNACKGETDLSHMEVSFERMKYKQVGDGKLEPSIQKPKNHTQFRISISNQFDRNISLEELLKNHCLEINEVEENGIKIRYRSEDQYVSLPNHLIIDLFTNDRSNTSGVCIPTNLFFPQEILKDKHSTHKYELNGFVVHLGSSDKSGHYIAFCKVNGQWKEFNDNRVTDIDQKKLQFLLGEEKQNSPYSNPYIYMLSYSKTPSS